MGIVVGIITLLVVLGAIFVLTQQNTRQTGDVALRAERLLMRIVTPTGKGDIGEPTWFGLTIRKLAHIAEFGALGLATGVVSAHLLGTGPIPWATSSGLCFVASFADELHKHFVPGRHFDAQDMVLDAAGYLPATTLVALIALLLS
jgi:VanZ family protein